MWRDQARPALKRYWAEVPPLPPPTVWNHLDVGSTAEGGRELRRLLRDLPGYPASPPERLLHRILTVASAPGDLVLDSYGRAGTTAAVAHKTDRRWITIEQGFPALQRRLDKVVAGEDPGGISEAVGWSGGGSYEVLVVEPECHDEPQLTMDLAEAMADGYTRTAAVVYRGDGRKDLETRLVDACREREAAESEWGGSTPPLLFVVCDKTSQAKKAATVLRGQTCLLGDGAVLVAGEGSVTSSVRAVVGAAEYIPMIASIAVVVAYRELSPTAIRLALLSDSEVRKVDLIAHGPSEPLMASFGDVLRHDVPVDPDRARWEPARQPVQPRRSIVFPVGKQVAGGVFSLGRITDTTVRNAGATVRREFPVPLLRQEVVAERTADGKVDIRTKALSSGTGGGRCGGGDSTGRSSSTAELGVGAVRDVPPSWSTHASPARTNHARAQDVKKARSPRPPPNACKLPAGIGIDRPLHGAARPVALPGVRHRRRGRVALGRA